MLYEPAKNTELAASYLDKLFVTYGDSRLVLAEYNGGPVNARRMRNGSDRLAAETRDYVAKVIAVLDELNGRLASETRRREPVRVAALDADPRKRYLE
jgi:soluble lytic murein transglycosylase-like protein